MQDIQITFMTSIISNLHLIHHTGLVLAHMEQSLAAHRLFIRMIQPTQTLRNAGLVHPLESRQRTLANFVSGDTMNTQSYGQKVAVEAASGGSAAAA
jgi:hypothetical protein